MSFTLTAKQRYEGFGKCLKITCNEITKNRSGYCEKCRTVSCDNEGCLEKIIVKDINKKNFCKHHKFSALKYNRERRIYE